MSAVNVAEVSIYYVRQGNPASLVQAMIQRLGIHVIAADQELAYAAAELEPFTRSRGLSLGDRFCLALTRRLDAVALTSDQAWRDIADLARVRIELIR